MSPLPVCLDRKVRGSLQHGFLLGAGEKLRPPARHRRTRLQGEPVGRQQGQLHHGEVTRWCDPSDQCLTESCPLLSQSLTGHKSPVECVQFSMSEDQIVTGSQSGSIRVWDMEAAKSKREGKGSMVSKSVNTSLHHINIAPKAKPRDSVNCRPSSLMSLLLRG